VDSKVQRPGTSVTAEEAVSLEPVALDAAPDAPYSPRRSPITDRRFVIATLALDALMLVLAILSAIVGARAANLDTTGTGLIWLMPPVVIGLLALRGMYRPKVTLAFLDDAGHVVGATSVAAMVIVAIAALALEPGHYAQLAARAWVFGILYVAGGRLVLGLNQRAARRQRTVGKTTLIVGAGRIGAQVERRLEELPELGLRPVGYVDAFPPSEEQVGGRRSDVLGGPDDLAKIVEKTGAEHVVIAFLSSRGSDAKLVQIVRECDQLGLEVSLVPRLFESINVRVGLEHIGGMPLFRLRMVRPKGWQFVIKHALDRVAAALLIVLLSPVLLGSALAIKLSSPGPIFFRQRRMGRDGREFDLLKFRSMRMPDPDSSENVLMLLPENTAPGGVEGADRRTAVGTLLRRYSLDELPQLFNVLRGEMSIVGPRPERTTYVRLFEEKIYRYSDRHRVKSGVTGWAQVHGLRGKTSLSDRTEWDNFYIENWSLWLDFKILVMTVGAIFKPAE
jgi:exopolysaccharide biosynthesis polyprenyl glycosylphosphotransferase